MNSTQLRKLLDWRTLAAVTGDGVWRLLPPCPAPVAADTYLDRVHIAWPHHYQHPNADPFVAGIRDAFAVGGRLTTRDIPQPYEGVVVFEVDPGEGERIVAIDYFDLPEINPECAAKVDVYFKMQYLRGGYGPDFAHVRPGGYVTSAATMYRNWCRFRRLHRTSQPSTVIFGRFGLRFSADVRRLALDLLSQDARLEFAGGARQTKLSWYLREMARAGVCIDLPGRGPFCYRLVEAMAMGACVIGPPHATRLPVELRPGIEIVQCREDLSDLADLCALYSHDPEAAERVGQAAASYFDEHLHPMRLISYYVREIRDGEAARAGRGTGARTPRG